MSNLTKKIIKVNIEDKDYIMAFDMKSIETYKELTNSSFTLGYSKLMQLDDTEIINFLGVSLRPVEDEENPIGKKVYDMDILNLLINYSGYAIDLVLNSLPKNKNSKKK